MRTLILVGLLFLVFFVVQFFREEHRGYNALFLLLSLSLGYKLLKVLFEWYHYWAVQVPVAPALRASWTVDMLTTAVPGEPFAMIEKTLWAMVAVRSPHTTYLCDEGDDPRLKKLCHSLGVIHVARKDKRDAKAGNINHALQQATGEITVILDPDHVPEPQFLDEVLPFFEREDVGFVQTVQGYSNSGRSWIARSAAQQTYSFYGPLMMGMGRYGTAQAIGANCVFRRAALDSIGGHAPGLAEDMHTAMQLHARGWKSVYLPKMLTRGLVPANLAAYYKQQLKWSRGTFELLFTVYPKLFRRFTGRQKLHYGLLPLHYAAGIVVLIDLLLPVFALLSGDTPLRIETGQLLMVVLPLLCMVLLVRQYAQRWLLEKKEHGFHFSGGVLLAGTWWVYITGLFYTLFRVEVPYIPTPKEDERSNNLVLNIPNAIVCLLTAGAISYGLSHDWTPYSWTMAGYGAFNIMLLLCTILGSQQLVAQRLSRAIQLIPFSRRLLQAVSRFTISLLSGLYKTLRLGAPLLAVLVLFGFYLVQKTEDQQSFSGSLNKVAERTVGGFYTGIYMPQVQSETSLAPIEAFGQNAQNPFSIVSLYEFWGPESLRKFPQELLTAIIKKGSIPMITWEPWVSSFPERRDAPGLRWEQKGLAAIASGKLDEYIRAYAKKIRDLDHPVFIRFAHEPDNPQYPWSAKGGNTPEEYINAWRKVVTTFVDMGVQNVTWVYNPWDHRTVERYYPGDQYVDWVGLTCLNYGKAGDGKGWQSFEQVYGPFRSAVLELKKPVMLAEFGSTHYGGDGDEWVKKAVTLIKKDYKEISGVVLFNSNQDKNWVTDWRPSAETKTIDWTIKNKSALLPLLKEYHPFLLPVDSARLSSQEQGGKKKRAPAVNLTGEAGSFSLMTDGKPFYIKGVAYNPQHSWEDGNEPLTRRQLEKDFKAIREMGANTIRRYHPSVYDRNIFSVAEEQKLKVLYGFWFDPAVDYARDTATVAKYLAMVEENVEQYNGHPPLLAWSIGNESSGLLKKHFQQPYLGIVRNAYMAMLEKMAQRIRQLDPLHPVMTALEHSWQLPGDVYAHHLRVPSVDVIGVNSYYESQISQLDTIFRQFDPNRPYVVSEFGPKGYWNPELTQYDENGLLAEDRDADKAALYAKEWRRFIEKNKGRNIGGIAFSWKDRMEGTATWFGITDNKGRKKPVYHYLKKLWNKEGSSAIAPDLFIVGPNYRLKPGGEYEFTAVMEDGAYQHFEWFLHEEGSFAQKNSLINVAGRKAAVKIRAAGKVYRLYVSAADDKGNVITANRVIHTYKGLFNDGL
jgi:cellulose synthase/poly-beta-1,6-N-acetylglucosamine synthase-like glycosyltransferase